MVQGLRRATLIRSVAVAAMCVAMMVGFSAPVSADGFASRYGQHDNFGNFAGQGFTVHHGADGESDVNVCSTDAPFGVASCHARVVTQPAASAATASGPSADSTSACPSSDVNAPSAVIGGGNGGYDPCYLQSAYNVASLAEARGGAGQIIAIDDYSVDPNIASDLAAYRSQFGLPACPSGTVSHANSGCVFEQAVQSGAPASGNSGWDLEISLDVDAISAICPNCQILLVETNSASFSALGSGVNTAVADGANAVSNSYGGGESSGENSVATQYYQHPGVAIVASSGDAAGVVEFPASAPDVTTVGGTSLLQYSAMGKRSSNATETVWNGTPAAGDGAGAGCSAYEAAPSWQSTFLASAPAVCSNRVTADVSADADPDTGLWVYDTYSQGGWLIVGGTSLASPTIAAIYGLAGNASGSSAYPVATAYANSSTLYHVTSGNVGSCGNYLCDATKAFDGYSGPAGLGTPGGTGSLAAFTYNPAAPPSTPAPPTVTATTQTSVTLSWSAVSGATSYNVLDGASPSSLATAVTGVSGTSATVPNLTPNTTYYFAVSAANASGTSNPSGSVPATTAAVTVPGAPTLNSATAGNASVTLGWTAPSSNGGSLISGYDIYQGTSTGAESSTPISGSPFSGTSATVSGLVNGTTYYFKVAAVNGVGPGGQSNELSAKPVVLTVPGGPTLNSATAGNGSVTLGWTAPSSNGGSTITGYRVYDGTSSSGVPSTLVTTVTGTTDTVSGLTNATAYYFVVEAVNSVGPSGPSNELSATPTAGAVPGSPTLLSAQAGRRSVSLTWSAPSGSVSGYSVYIGTSPGGESSTPVNTSLITSTRVTVTGLSRGTTYYFVVRAVNAAGSSAPSNELSATSR